MTLPLPESRDMAPAFPLTDDNYASRYCNEGMLMRDYFAAHASEKAIQQYMPKGVVEIKFGVNTFREMAMYTREEAAYRYADAMMGARK